MKMIDDSRLNRNEIEQRIWTHVKKLLFVIYMRIDAGVWEICSLLKIIINTS